MQSRRSFFVAAMAASVFNPVRGVSAALDGETAVSRFAFGSCAKQWEPQPIWNAIAARKPDFFLFLGDAIYGDWHGEEPFIPTPNSLRADWAKLAAIPEFNAFRSETPILATWDNHDYGKHDGGAEFDLKEQSKEIFLDFFGEPINTARRNRPGIYDSQIIGPKGRRVQIILLDCRSFKSPYVVDKRDAKAKAALNIRGQYLPNFDPDASLLGPAQWEWLQTELMKPADIRFIASGTQIVADKKAMEEWGNFPLERRKLFDLIGKTNANGVVLLSGNVHFSEISATDEGAYPLVDFTSSGMTHTDPAYAGLRNDKRIFGPYTEFNFGQVDIDWGAVDGPEVGLTCFDANGQQRFQHSVSVTNLKAG